VVYVETRHMMALLKAQQINQSDRNDARGIAQMLSSRRLLQRKLLDEECDLHGTLRHFGLEVAVVSTGKFEARIREPATSSCWLPPAPARIIWFCCCCA
jgi:transposase